MNAPMNESTVQTAQSTPSYIYTKRDCAAAWIIFALSLLLYDAVLDSRLGLSSTLFVLALYVVGGVYLRLCGVRLRRHIYLPVLGVLLAVSFFFTDNTGAKSLVLMFSAAVYVLWLLYACQNGAKGFGMLWYDALKAVFVMPFSGIPRLFGAMAGVKSGKKPGKTALMIVGGILLAVLPTIAVVMLLARADSGFLWLIDNLDGLGLTFGETVSNGLVRLFVGICFACLVFGAVFTNSRRLYTDSLSGERNDLRRAARAVAPQTLVYAAATPMLVVYVVFFAMQFRYFTSAFASVLPAGIDNYADYARSGFFELCLVSLINFAVILCISAFTKRSDGKTPLAARIYCVIYSAVSIAFAVMVISKMALYIKKFGLTRLRVYTTLFMVMLGVLFVLLIVRQLKRSFDFTKGAAAVVCVFALVFAFGRFDAVIADFNVNAYLDGRHEEIDVYELSCLSGDAYPALRELYENADSENVKSSAAAAMEEMEQRRATHSAFDVNLSDIIISRLSGDGK